MEIGHLETLLRGMDAPGNRIPGEGSGAYGLKIATIQVDKLFFVSKFQRLEQ